LLLQLYDQRMRLVDGGESVHTFGDRPLITLTATEFAMWWEKLRTAVLTGMGEEVGALLGFQKLDVKAENCFIHTAAVVGL
jgi:hypothetical protein